MITFWHGTATQYAAVTTKDNDTLYFLTDGNGGIYKGSKKIAELSGAAVTEIMGILGDTDNMGYDDVASAIKALSDAITVLNASETTAGSVKKSIADAITALDLANTYDAKGAAAAVLGEETDTSESKTVYGALAAIAGEKTRAETAEGTLTTNLAAEVTRAKAAEGDLETLGTTKKDSLVNAINELKQGIAAGGEAGAITIDSSTTTEGAAKSYTIKQGGVTIGTIDIPKDMVVTGGEVVKDPEGQDPGTYIKITLANVEDPLYVNVGTLVDIYTAQQNAVEVQLVINPTTREISATIVNGSVTADKLAIDAVTTDKIADGNVTKDKLSTTVQGSLDLADNAVQAITEGTANGTIGVDGTDVTVHGLKSAAFTESTAYDAAGAADTVKTALEAKITILESALTWKTAEATEPVE